MSETQDDSSQSCSSSREIQFDGSVGESFVLGFKDRVKHNSSWQPFMSPPSRNQGSGVLECVLEGHMHTAWKVTSALSLLIK